MPHDLSQLMNEVVRHATLMKMIFEIKQQLDGMNKTNQHMINEMKEMMIATHQNWQNQLGQLNADVHEYMNQMLNQLTPKARHVYISTDGYIDAIMDAYTNMSIDGHFNFTKDVVKSTDEEIKEAHIDMSTDGYEMSTCDNFQKQSCENKWRNQV